jgi:hypothetical protein
VNGEVGFMNDQKVVEAITSEQTLDVPMTNIVTNIEKTQ